MQQINFQAPMKASHPAAKHSLLVHSIFYTLQGEGPYAGRPAVFIRLGGCNLQCPGCDTDYTKEVEMVDAPSIIQSVHAAWADYKLPSKPLVVITGGEPFRQPIAHLCSMLGSCGYKTQIETNGTLGIPEEMGRTLWLVSKYPPDIVVSPKAGKVHPDLYPYITAYKYVLDCDHIDPDDGLPTSVLGMPARPARPHPGYSGPIYLQPADEPKEWLWPECRGLDDPPNQKNVANMEAVVKSCLRFGYTLCLQTHKIAGVE